MAGVLPARYNVNPAIVEYIANHIQLQHPKRQRREAARPVLSVQLDSIEDVQLQFRRVKFLVFGVQDASCSSTVLIIDQLTIVYLIVGQVVVFDIGHHIRQCLLDDRADFLPGT